MKHLQQLVLQANNDFKKHTQNVVEMKKDLENIFKRLKNIKQKLNKQMPEAYNHVAGPREEVVREEDDEYDIAIRERRLREQQQSQNEDAVGTVETASEVVIKEVTEIAEEIKEK